MSKQEHSPLPFEYVESNLSICASNRNTHVCLLEYNDNDGNDGPFIARACNCHDNLVAALEAGKKFSEAYQSWLEEPTDDSFMAMARAHTTFDEAVTNIEAKKT